MDNENKALERAAETADAAIPRPDAPRHDESSRPDPRGGGPAEPGSPDKPRLRRPAFTSIWQVDVLPGRGRGAVDKFVVAVVVEDGEVEVVHGELHPGGEVDVVEDCLRRALERFGEPEVVYRDNHKLFSTDGFRLATDELGLGRLMTPIRAPRPRGGPERRLPPVRRPRPA